MNKTILLGRLTKDPELTFAAESGKAVARFSLAVTRNYKRDEADFINIVAFGKTAENIAKYFKKGSRILLEGEIRTGSYDAKDGTKRYTTDVILHGFEFVDSKKQDDTLTGDDYMAGNNFNYEEDMTPIDDGDMPF